MFVLNYVSANPSLILICIKERIGAQIRFFNWI